LLRTQSGYDSIWVIVDRLTKVAHFIPVKTTYSRPQLAELYMDMDPHQQTSIILEKPFLKSVRATIDKMRGIINMKVDRVHEKFIYHTKNLACCCQI
jgi:hypothetical protein